MKYQKICFQISFFLFLFCIKLVKNTLFIIEKNFRTLDFTFKTKNEIFCGICIYCKEFNIKSIFIEIIFNIISNTKNYLAFLSQLMLFTHLWYLLEFLPATYFHSLILRNDQVVNEFNFFRFQKHITRKVHFT